jgi:predicted nucleotidyltransferase
MNPLEKAVEIIIGVTDPERIVLFGSRARGTPAPDSDYDLLVLKKNCAGKRRLAQDVYCSMRDVGAPVDVIVEDVANYELLKNDATTMYPVVEREGRVVYERA